MIDNVNSIAVCFNAPVAIFDSYSGKPKDGEEILDDMSETSFLSEVNHVVNALKAKYKNVYTVSITKDIHKNIETLKSLNLAAAFNLVESVEGIAEYEMYHAGLYDLLNISYTGNPPQALGNCLNKSRAKQILRANNIDVPNAVTAQPGNKNTDIENLRFPLITKLLKEDASIGISEHSVVNNKEELEKQLEYLFTTYRQAVIVEEYIEGREFNIGILGETVLPVSEISFEGLPADFPKIVTYEGKWMQESLYYKHTVPLCPAPIDDDLHKKLESIAKMAFKAMGCRDYARVDVRVDKNGNPFVIEVNPNPDISTDAGFPRAASKINITYDDLILKIAGFALERKYSAA